MSDRLQYSAINRPILKIAVSKTTTACLVGRTDSLPFMRRPTIDEIAYSIRPTRARQMRDIHRFVTAFDDDALAACACMVCMVLVTNMIFCDRPQDRRVCVKFA